MAALLTLLALTAAPAAAPAEWVRVDSRNFIVYGSSGEGRAREVAAEFERFREALARVIPNAATPGAVPTTVVIFDSQRSFEAYRPRFNGKPISLSGYFFSSEDANVVAFADVDRAESLRTIFHEYVHLVIVNTFHGTPTWLNEGLAEYYSTFRVEDGGRRALLGGPIPSHLQFLSRTRLMPLEELLAVTRESAAYNEGNRRSLFYAQSWALVHMLMSGPDNRSADVNEYVRLVESNTPSIDAWKTVFGDEKIIAALGRYVNEDVMRGTLFRFDRDIPRATSDLRAVSDADAAAMLADLLRRVAPYAEASASFEKAIGMTPPSARARALYGLHLREHDEVARANALLLEAAADGDDWLVQYHVATGLGQTFDAIDPADPRLLETARAALGRVLDARPELPNALALRARLDATDKARLDEALADIRRARELAPGRDDYRLFEAHVHARRGEYVQARAILDVLAAPGFTDAIRANARSLLAQVDRSERLVAERIARLEGRQAAGAPGQRPGSTPRSAVPRYRDVSDDETRLEGVLERITCTAEGIQLHVKAEAATEQFDATTLDGIEFISYREDLDGAIRCGARTPPEPVYVTWKKGGATRRVVAVEFLLKH
jgi:tetratricopeptide (TPR) repeat protein